MGGMLGVSRFIDRLTGWLGEITAWLALVMVLVGAFNSLARYGGQFIGVNLSSNLYLELQWYLFSLLFLLGASWALREDAHVRVDVLYAKLSTMEAWPNQNAVGGHPPSSPSASSPSGLPFLPPSNEQVAAVRKASPDPGGSPAIPSMAVHFWCCFVD